MARSIGRINMRGFSTLEILIAMAIMTSTLAAVVLVSFGNQSLLAQGGSNAEAVRIAQEQLETAQAQAREDFRLLSSESTTSDEIFHAALTVSDAQFDPYTTKRLTSMVTWSDESHLTRSVSISELVTDFDDSSTLDTCDSSLAGDWSAPSMSDYVLAPGDLLPSNPPAGHTFSAGNQIAALDAYHGILYVAAAKRSSAANDSLFMFDVADPTKKPRYLGSFDNNPAVTEGLNSLIAAGKYVYAGNAHVSNFKSCAPSANCSQLQIFDVSNPSAVPSPVNFLIPTSTAPFVSGTSTSQALGNSIFYRDGYVYLGLSKTAIGPEFDIIDVHDLSHPKWVGGYAVGSSINEIYVRNGLAYLATDDKSREFIVLDVHDPANPTFDSSFDPTGTLGYEVGKSIYAHGNTMFAGMSAASGSPELYSLDISHPAMSLPKLAATVVGSTILGAFARDSTLFILASTIRQFQSLDISDPASYRQAAAPIALPGTGASLDCEGNYFFIGSNDGTQGHISIVGPRS